MNKKKEVALVLSSGGARGIAHIGAIEELEARGYSITSISGTSIGAVIGGFYAAGKLSDYRDWISSLDGVNVFNLIDFSISTTGIIKGERVFKKLSEWMEGMTFDDLRIPFSCVAVDLYNRSEVVFKSGNVLEAMRASIALPGYLEPKLIDGNFLYDGGIINPIPTNRVARTHNDLLVAVDLNVYKPDFNPQEYWQEEVKESKILARLTELWNSTTQHIGQMQKKISNELPSEKSEEVLLKDKKLSHIGALNEMFELMQESVGREVISKNKPDVMIEIPRNLCSTFEFHRSAELIEFGRLEMQKALDEFEKQ